MRSTNFAIGHRVKITNPSGTAQHTKGLYGEILGTDEMWDWQVLVDGWHDPIGFNESELENQSTKKDARQALRREYGLLRALDYLSQGKYRGISQLPLWGKRDGRSRSRTTHEGLWGWCLCSSHGMGAWWRGKA